MKIAEHFLCSRKSSPQQFTHQGCDKPSVKMSASKSTRPCGASEWDLLAVRPTTLPFVTRCVARAV